MPGVAFTIPAGVLHAACEWAGRATPSKAMVPILQGLLIDAGRDEVSITGFDFERRASVTVGAFVEVPGRVVIPGRLLTAIAAVAGTKTDLIVDTRPAKATVTADRARWTVPTLAVDEYPQLPTPGDPIGTVSAAGFSLAARRVLPVVYRGPGQEAIKGFTGVKVEAANGELTMAATDRYRLSHASIPWTGDDLDVLIPGSLLEIAARIADTGQLNIHTGQGNLFGVSSPTHLLAGSQLGEKYPAWRNIIPVGEDWSAAFPSEDLELALKQVAPALTKETRISFTSNADGVTVKAVGPDGDGAEVGFDADHVGEPITIGFAAEYLKAALDTLRSDKVSMFFAGERRAARLVGDDPSHAHIVMPKTLS